ncbi:MAG TPA: FMN-binding negative transcriptional regulator, partial [Ilumatobacteraceae bacterium]
MYRPRHFDEQDPDALRDMLGRAPLGHLVVHTAAGFDASPLPFIARPPEADGEVLRLHGHVARRNPIWRVAPCD